MFKITTSWRSCAFTSTINIRFVEVHSYISMYPPLLNFIFPLSGSLPNISSAFKGRCATLLHQDASVSDSLCLQCAITCASQDELITYITPKPFTKLPPDVHGMPNAAARIMKNITFLYLTNVEEIRNFLADIKQPFPSLIVLDRLDFFLKQLGDNDWDCSVAKLLALLIDTSHFIGEQRNQTCPLIATYANEDCTSKKNIWKLFFTHLWTVEYIEAEKKYNLNTSGFGNFEFNYKITFYVKENQLFLDKLYEIK